MPEMDGFQLYQKMKKIDSKVKVCFLTASELYHERSRKEEGCCVIDKDLFVQKPIGKIIKSTWMQEFSSVVY
jgi:CheY-like chemotaxis protein